MTRQPTLTLGPGLELPPDAVTRAGVITGQRGTGKTSTAVVEVEEASRAGAPSVIIDPTDAWWGLRSSRSGKGPGLPHVVFGGDHAHLPLRPESGRVMARLIVEQRLSAVFSLKQMRKGEQLRFVTEFLEELYHQNREVLLLVIDEAHRFAPQNLRDQERGGYGARCLGALVDVASLGRVNGIGVRLITQRLARVHTDAREACEIMIIHRLLGPNDRKAIQSWLQDAGQEDEASQLPRRLPNLKRGQALVYAPDLGLLGEYEIRVKSTFDSSGTPKVGESRVVPKGAADVDLAAIEQLIGETIEEAKQDDPAHLRSRIHQLERDLAAAQAQPPPEPQTVREVIWPFSDQEFDQAISTAEEMITAASEARTRLEQLLPAFDGHGHGLLSTLRTWRERKDDEATAIDQLAKTGLGNLASRGRPPSNQPTQPPPQRPGAYTTPDAGPTPAGEDNGEVTGLAREILTAMAQFHPRTLTSRQLGMITGKRASGGYFKNTLGSLRTRGLVDGLTITSQGLATIGRVPGAPTPAQTIELWRSKLEGLRLQIFDLLLEHPEGLTNQQIAEAVGKQPDAGYFKNMLGSLRSLELVTKTTPQGPNQISPDLYLTA